MAISNNTIVVLLALSIVVSGTSIYNSMITGQDKTDISGMSVTGGKTNISILSSASITFQDGYNETYFGEGSPNAGSSLTIATDQENSNGFYNGSYCNGSAVPDTSGTAVTPLCIMNDGSDDSTCVKINATDAPTAWMTCQGACGQTPNARIKAYDNSTSACASGLRNTWGQLNETQRTICTSLGTSETMGVDLELTLPQNPSTGELTTTIAIEGSDNC